ncbi:uncharacterized protein LOC144995684 [Oryzias latipes]
MFHNSVFESLGATSSSTEFQAETQHQHDQTRILEKQNEEMVQEIEKLQDKLLVLSDRKAKYEPAGDHLKAVQDQNSVLKKKLLQLKIKIQKEEALLMDISPQDLLHPDQIEEIKCDINSLRQEQEVLLKKQMEIEKSKSETQALLKEFHQAIKNVEYLKKKNYDLSWDLMVLNVDIFEFQQLPHKLQTAKKEEETARKEKSLLTQQVSQCRSQIQQELALLLTTLDISPDDLHKEYQGQIKALQKQNAVLQKNLEELKHHQDSAMRMDLSNLEAQKSHLESQCEHIREVIQIQSQQQDGELVYPEQTEELKSEIKSLRQEKKDLLEEQREMENSKLETQALLKEFHQVNSNIEDLKKINYDLKWELKELHVDILEEQGMSAKLEASKKEQEFLQKENAVLTDQMAECRSKIHQQTSVVFEPQSPARNQPSRIPRPVSVRKSEPKQVSMDTGRPQQPQNPARNQSSLIPGSVFVEKSEPKPVSMNTGKIQKLPVLLKKRRCSPENHPSPSELVSVDIGKTQQPRNVLTKPQSPPALKLPTLIPKPWLIKESRPDRQDLLVFKDVGKTQQLKIDEDELPFAPGKLLPLTPLPPLMDKPRPKSSFQRRFKFPTTEN